MDLDALTRFIVAAKRSTYVGGGRSASASRPGAHDLTFEDGLFAYRDSYFGGTDFLGQEVVWHMAEPVWAMSYYGYILRPDLIDAVRAGATIKAALAVMYADGRFLGGFDWQGPHGAYEDRSTGDAAHFSRPRMHPCRRRRSLRARLFRRADQALILSPNARRTSPSAPALSQPPRGGRHTTGAESAGR